MDEQRWHTLQEKFDLLVDMPAPHQAVALRALYESDPIMAEEVQGLLEEDACGEQLPELDLDNLLKEALHPGKPPVSADGQIGPYRILKLLGEGGMGVVYLAARTDIGGHVAIKLLRDAWLSPVRRQRFAIEQQMLGLLKHPSIARIYDAGTTKDGTPWFVMEFSDGVPITEYLQQRRLSVRDMMNLVGTVCEAVRYAHSLAIIHRDLKPSNILVTDDGQIKLLDFGIAKQLDIVNRGSTATTIGFRLFTPAYAPPELQSENRVGVFTDIYAVGAILYQLLTGNLPFPDGTPGDRLPQRPSRVMQAAVAGDGASASKNEWTDLDAICMKALDPTSEERYLSMDALIEDIHAFLDDRPVSARENALLYTTRKFLERNRSRVLGVAAVLFLVIAGTVLFTVRLAKARGAAAQSRDQAIGEAARSARVQHFTESLFTGGASFGFPPPDIKVTQMLSRGRSEALQIFGDPQLQAAMFQSLGTAYNALGYYADAEPLVRRAQQTICSSGPSLQCADIEETLGESLAQIGSPEEALGLDRDVLQIREQRLPANDLSLARAMTNLGGDLAVSGLNAEAAEFFRRGVETATAAGHPSRELAFALTSLASRGLPYNDPQSIAYATKAANMDLQLFGPTSFEFARDESGVSAVLLKHGRLDEAEHYARSSLGTVQTWSGPEEPITARYALRLIEVLDQEGKFQEAKTLGLRTLHVIQASNPPSSLEEGDAFFDLGFGELEMGHLKAAMAEYEAVQSLADHRMAVGAVSLEYSQVGRAEIYQREGDYNRAESILRQELAKSQPASGYSIVASHSILGRVLLQQGKYTEAESELLKAYAWFSHDPALRPHTVQTYRDLADIEVRLGRSKESARFIAELRAHAK